VAKLIGKLKAKPDLAAQKLGQALGEVAKTLQVVDSAASEFLSLGIDEGALAKDSKLLLNIEGGSLGTEVRRGRGHCDAIWQIYSKYLDKWFESAFKSDEYASVKAVFHVLGSADGDLFYDLEQVAVTLQNEAIFYTNQVVRWIESKQGGNKKSLEAGQCLLGLFLHRWSSASIFDWQQQP
jgi:hypothetical protein